jgi:hypothetical protein
MNALRETLEKQTIRSIVSRALPLSEARSAHRLLECRATVGRTVLYHAEQVAPADEIFWNERPDGPEAYKR